MALFDAWYDAARDRVPRGQVNAMACATSGPGGVPSVRMVLLKQVVAEQAGFTWFTNLDSRKAREALATGHAALSWWWPGGGDLPERQVRAVGRVELVRRPAVQEYFTTRPAAARRGAASSHQSRAIASRSALESRAEQRARRARSGRLGRAAPPRRRAGVLAGAGRTAARSHRVPAAGRHRPGRVRRRSRSGRRRRARSTPLVRKSPIGTVLAGCACASSPEHPSPGVAHAVAPTTSWMRSNAAATAAVRREPAPHAR